MNASAKFATGVLIGVAAMAGCYAFAATTAGHIAASVEPESVRSSRRGSAVAAKLGDPRWKAIRDWTTGVRAAPAS